MFGDKAQAMAAQWNDAPGLATPMRVGEAGIWLGRRNCSLSPSQLLGFFASLALVSMLVAGMCWINGGRLVPAFTGAELLLFAGALLVYARHAADRERVEFGADRVVVEWESAGQVERTEFPSRHTRILMHDNGLIVFRAGDREAFVGRYTRPERREALARQMRRALLAA